MEITLPPFTNESFLMRDSESRKYAPSSSDKFVSVPLGLTKPALTQWIEVDAPTIIQNTPGYSSYADIGPSRYPSGCLWPHGLVYVQSLPESNCNPCSFLSAYLADDQAPDVQTKGGKRFSKNDSLHLCPCGMRFYRTSRGIKRIPSATTSS